MKWLKILRTSQSARLPLSLSLESLTGTAHGVMVSAQSSTPASPCLSNVTQRRTHITLTVHEALPSTPPSAIPNSSTQIQTRSFTDPIQKAAWGWRESNLGKGWQPGL
ncbi:hypothetical protein BDV12DRAFT_87372 [Aspergillus spectabilis]